MAGLGGARVKAGLVGQCLMDRGRAINPRGGGLMPYPGSDQAGGRGGTLVQSGGWGSLQIPLGDF